MLRHPEQSAEPVHPLQPEIDALLMQRRQPPDQFTERWFGTVRGGVHACGAASGADMIWAGLTTGCTDFGAVSSAGDFVSYWRAVRSERSSNGRKKGENNSKCGNAYLSWAFVEAAHCTLRYDSQAQGFTNGRKPKPIPWWPPKHWPANWPKPPGTS